MMYKSHKAQTTVEFLAIVGFILLVSISILGAIQYSRSEKIREKTDIAVNDLARTIQSEINLAFESSNGYEREFELPEKVMGKEYNVTLVDGLVYVNTLDEKHAVALSIPEISGDIRVGINKIERKNNQVYINNG
ncbi:MAG: hypothetical protein ACP5D2_01425 [Candidatus Nanoarchaeia archaeon]